MKSLVLVLTMVLCFSCNNKETYNKIAGEWKCSKWITTGVDKNKCNNNVYFKFNPDKTYSSEIGSSKETGVYSISDGKLYTTAENKLEIAVEISKLNEDTLEFIMSRSGSEEILTLNKVK